MNSWRVRNLRRMRILNGMWTGMAFQKDLGKVFLSHPKQDKQARMVLATKPMNKLPLLISEIMISLLL